MRQVTALDQAYMSSAWLPYTKVTGRTAVRVAIGEALGSSYEVPRDLPHDLLAC